MPKRLTSHPLLTPERLSELNRVAEQEESFHNSPDGQAEFQRMRERLQARQQLLAGLLSQFSQAQADSGMSLEELAANVEMGQAELSELLAGKNINPSVDTLHRIALALNKQLVLELNG